MMLLYDILVIIAALIVFPCLVIKGKWHKDMVMRLGHWPSKLRPSLLKERKDTIWVHAVSVGEILAVMDLMQKIKDENPLCRIICSTVTKTGYVLAQSRLPDGVIFAPLDCRWCIERFINLIRPRLYIAVETEIWPNLFTALHRHHVPIVVINGRISDKSYKGYQRISFLMKKTLPCVGMFCMQTQLDAQRVVQLGASPSKIRVVGNLKFDLPAAAQEATQNDEGIAKGEKILLGGSTHPGEEGILLRAYVNLVKKFPSLRLIIAPRHVERAKEIDQLVRDHHLEPVRFSSPSSQKMTPSSVIVVDTMGHLRRLYALAAIVFVGKSLTVGGGQNVIEPAVLGKPVVVGPHTYNFREVIRVFLQEKAMIQVQNEKGLAAVLYDLLVHPAKISEIGGAAKKVVEANRGATEKTLGIIRTLLNPGTEKR